MATFGSFETEREVYSDPIYTVYSAKKSGEAQSQYALKVFSIQGAGLDIEAATDLAPLLVDIEDSRVQCIDVQAKAAAVSRCVAPVFEKGQDERGVWYATCFYPRSVNKIILGKVALTREALQHLIRSIAQGALDLKRTCGRSHGDILPSNVQISRSEKLREADIVISDPLPGGEEEAVNFEINDLRSIGRILLQLAQQRAIGNEEDFLILPILSSPQWTRLFGKDTEAWLSICNRLLDPNLSLEQITLDRLIAELDALEPKKAVSPKLLIAAAAGIVCLAALAALLLRPRAQQLTITSDPPGATILLDKKEIGQAAPLTVKLKKGKYLIEAQHAAMHLQAQSTNLNVTSGGSVQLHFQFPYGTVVIQSEPPGATITTEGTTLGKTPADSKGFVIPVLPAGSEVKYELSLPDHATKTLHGVVTAGQRLVLSETLPLSKDVGVLEMDSRPAGARVFWKDKLLASATPERVELEQGTYLLRAVYKDWPEKQLTVELKSGKLVPANFYFENGLIDLESDPKGATVWIGTNNLGNTPLSVRRPVGETSFRFDLTGFESTNLVVKVAENAKVRVRPTLISENGVFEFTADPADALILDDKGNVLGSTASGVPLKFSRSPGTYSFSARIKGLADATATLTAEKRKMTPHTFQFEYGSVTLTSDPPGAAISVDGKALGFTPATLVQKPGQKVSYVISLTDYRPVTNDVTLQSTDRNRPIHTRLAPEPVSVALTSEPAGAQFYLGPTPLAMIGGSYQLPWGTNVVTARHPVFSWLEPVTNSLVVHKGSLNEKLFTFDYGLVSFETIPPDAGAGVYEVGQLLGHTPTNLYVRPGPVAYEVIYEDQTNRLATNVIKFATHVFPPSKFEIKRDYTNSIGMVLVRVKDPLYVCKFEITQEQFQQVMGRGLEGKPRQPMVNVKWAEAQAFCQKLSQLDAGSGVPKKAHLDGWSYGLPSQSEWSRFSEADPGQLVEAVFDSRLTEPKEIDPARKSANKTGLYDLYGNVAEWALGPGEKPVTIGGSFYNRKPRQVPADLMVETQNLASPIADGSPNIGFRCVLRPPSP